MTERAEKLRALAERLSPQVPVSVMGGEAVIVSTKDLREAAAILRALAEEEGSRPPKMEPRD